MRTLKQYHLFGVVAFLLICLSVISTPIRAQAPITPSTFRVIIGLNAPFRPEGELPNLSAVTWQRFNIANRQKLVITTLSRMNLLSTHLHQFETIPYMALKVDAAGLLALKLDPNVTSIAEDQLRYINTSTANVTVNAPAAWAVGYNGAGYAVAILDTGVDFTHLSLTDKRLAEACFSNYWSDDLSACPNGQQTQYGVGAAMPPSGCSQCSHGTHVAGIAAGNGEGNGSPHESFRGVAPNADLIAVNVFTLATNGSLLGSYDSDQIRGMEYIYSLRTTYNIAAVNLSLGGGQYFSEGECNNADYMGYYRAAVNNLVAAKIAVVAASGNEAGPNSPDNQFYYSMGAPACLTNVVSVGAVNNSNVVASFSNSASFLDLLAPGVSIRSTLPGNAFGYASGTSMATPYVSGTWAIMRQAYPNDSVDAILNRLKTYGFLVTDNRNGIQTRRIDVRASLPASGEISFASTTSNPSEGQVLNVNVNLDIGVGTINLPSPFTVNLNYGGTATRNSDYTAPNSITLTRSGGWSPNTFYPSAATIPVTILNDDFARGDVSETITISFATPIYGVPVTPTMPTLHTVTIVNTNVQVTGAVNFTSATYTTAEYGDTGLSSTIQVPITMTIANNTSNITGSITADIAYGGSAVQGTDYNVIQNNVVFDGTTFYQGTYTAYVPVTILPRSGSQGNRTFTMTISEPPHLDAILGSPSIATITIRETSNIKMNENELRYEITNLLQPSHQIDSVLPDFINGTGINMVVILDDGTVGTVSLTLPSQNGSNRVVLGTMTVNGQPASSSYVSIINAELPDLIMRGINNFISNRTGAIQRIEISQISDNEITFAYLP